MPCGIHFSIEHGQKMRRQRVLLTFDREVLLMVAHHRDQNFFRQGQVFGLEVSGEHGWPLGKMGDLVHQGLVFAPASARESPGSGVERLADAMAARGYVGHHKGCL